MDQTTMPLMPLGIDIFEKLRKDGYYYMDKTGLIGDLLSRGFEVQLFTRPRRFGKTLTMSMLEDFFDIARDSKRDFRGLAVSQDADLCEAWQNQWPVLFLTFKSVSGRTFDDAYGMLKALIADLCMNVSFLQDDDSIGKEDKVRFQKLKAEKADVAAVKSSLYLLMRMLHAHYGKPVILLIDEYDVPLAKAKDYGYYDEMIDVIRAMFDKALKTNPYLKFAVVTGCLKISKESIFTGSNHFVSDTITSERFDEYFGFTQRDVDRILADCALTEHGDEFREWYDGYRFGSADVYCPWDVLNHVNALQDNPKARPEAYWVNTSGNTILRKFLRKAGRTTKAEIERLMAGETTAKKVTEQLTYNELDKNIGNLWSVLYMTGYLTSRSTTDSGEAELEIPNCEIHEIFASQIIEWFEEDVVEREPDAFQAFCNALKKGDAETVEKQFNAFLRKSISIRDTFSPRKENFYHGILLGMLMSQDDWYTRSNSEAGDGYSDICVEIEDENTAFVIEVKYAERNALESECQKAMGQIEDMRYLAELREVEYETIHAYGIACHKKHCKVACKSERLEA